MMKRWATFIGSVVLTAAVAAQPAAATTLTYCFDASPEGFDPAMHSVPATFQASRPIYDRLVEIGPDSTEVVPGLAESWSISDDGREYTFSLRSGVPFHATNDFTPTREFNADDVVFSLARQWDTDHPHHGGNTWPYFDGMGLSDLLRSVDRIDDRTVSITLRRPDASFIQTLAMDFASVLSQEYADKLLAEGTPERLDREPAGTGPFRFVAVDEDGAIRYAANRDHWAGGPRVDELVIDISPDDEVRRKKFDAGVCQIMTDPAAVDPEVAAAEPAVTVVEQVGLDVGYLAYNTTQPPFDDSRVRTALNMAIDRQAIVETVYDGRGVVALSPLPPTVWSHDDVLADLAHDTQAARALLRTAGASDLRVTLWVMPAPRPYNPDPQQVAEMIAADWEAIGVGVDIVSDEWPEFLSRTADVDRDGAVLFGWRGDNGDPDNFLAVLLGCDAVGISNRAQWCHRPFEIPLLAAKNTADREKRADLYRQAQAIFAEEAPWLPLAHSIVRIVADASVESLTIDPFGFIRFDTIQISD